MLRIVLTAAALAAAALPTPGAEAAAMQAASTDSAEIISRQGREALNAGDYRGAARSFDRVIAQYARSESAGDAYYWYAFALYRQGDPGELRLALDALEQQKTRHPRARTRGDAETLATRIRGEMARRGDARAAARITTEAAEASSAGCGAQDIEMKTAALNALMQMDADRAIPILRQVLEKRDACSAKLRRHALFMVSQKRVPEATSILMNAMRTDPDRDVRKQAVFWLGQVRTDESAAALEGLLRSDAEDALKEQAVHALVEQRSERGLQVVRRLAEDRAAPMRLREQAVFWLGQRRSQENADFLRSLFGRLGNGVDAERKLQEKVLFSLSQMREMGNERWLLQVAMDSSHSIQVRKQALWTAGQAHVGAAELVTAYDRMRHPELREHAIWVLAQANDRVATDKLFAIAKGDPDIEMRKRALFWLGQSRDSRVQQLLLDIINQE